MACLGIGTSREISLGRVSKGCRFSIREGHRSSIQSPSSSREPIQVANISWRRNCRYRHQNQGNCISLSSSGSLSSSRGSLRARIDLRQQGEMGNDEIRQQSGTGHPLGRSNLPLACPIRKNCRHTLRPVERIQRGSKRGRQNPSRLVQATLRHRHRH